MADKVGFREGTNLKPKIKSMFIFNPKLGNKEGHEHEKLMYYYPESDHMDRKIKNAGLATAVVSFAQSFDPSGPCEALHTKKSKQVFIEVEPDYWMTLSVLVPHAAVDIDGEMVTEYFDDNVKDLPLQVLLKTMYKMFKFFNGTFEAIVDKVGLEGLKEQLRQFYTKYLKRFDLDSLDIFTVYQGVQFLPLDKLVFMKVHQLVNKLESSHTFLRRIVMLYGNQLMWSGLEREDMQVFYQYLITTLFPEHLIPSDAEPVTKQGFSVKLPLISSSPSSSQDDHEKGMYLLGAKSSGSDMLTRSSPTVYILVDGEMTKCTLCVYNVLNITFCMFLQAGVSPDVLRRVEQHFGELKQLSSIIVDYTSHSKAAQMDLQYRYIYFNAMNFAVKSPLLGKRAGYSAIPSELMRILVQIDKDHQHLEAAETILQTDQNLWLVYRKSGQRQFAVFFQKGFNFFDICGQLALQWMLVLCRQHLC
jgi:hypothetical protein